MPSIYIGEPLMTQIESRQAELQDGLGTDAYVSEREALYSLLERGVLEDIPGVDPERWS